jgi:MFS family permease
MALIDRLGRKPLLVFGLTGIALSMLMISWSFGNATYTLSHEAIAALPAAIDHARLLPLQGITFHSDVAFRSELINALGSDTFAVFESQLNVAAIDINPMLVLTGILAFVACFALSIGPVMWVLFSELFPNRVRAIGISFVGLVNSAVSFTVQLLFPWQLANLGNATTFLLYGLFAVVGLVMVVRLLPETRGRSLEQLEHLLGTA